MKRNIDKILVSTMPRAGTVYFSKFIALLFGYELVEPSFTGGFRPAAPDWDPYRFDKSYRYLKSGHVLTSHYQLDSGILDFISDRSLLPLYLYRDPRDAAVSAALYVKYSLEHHILHKYLSMLSDRDAIAFYINGGRINQEYLPDDMRGNKDGAVYFDGMSYFTINALNWLSCPYVTCVKYEDFFSDPYSIKKNLDNIGVSVSYSDIDRVVERHNFRAITGREIGVEDKKSHFRKGVSGDFVNYFDDQLYELVEKRIGSHIRLLGYSL